MSIFGPPLVVQLTGDEEHLEGKPLQYKVGGMFLDSMDDVRLAMNVYKILDKMNSVEDFFPRNFFNDIDVLEHDEGPPRSYTVNGLTISGAAQALHYALEAAHLYDDEENEETGSVTKEDSADTPSSPVSTGRPTPPDSANATPGYSAPAFPVEEYESLTSRLKRVEMFTGLDTVERTFDANTGQVPELPQPQAQQRRRGK